MNPRTAAVGFITLSLLVAGCSGGSRSKKGGGAASAAPPAGVGSQTFSVQSYLTQGPPGTPAITFALTAPADPASVAAGVSVFAFEDQDVNPGGTFRRLDGAASLDAAGTTLAFTPSRALSDGREVRILITADVVRARDGAPLERGGASAAVSFPQAVPGAVFEGRYAPRAGGAPIGNTPITSTPGTPTQGGTAPPPAPGSSFQPEAGTDVWHIDFELSAASFADDMGRHGLRSGDAATDAAARALVIREILGTASEKYGRTADGQRRPGVSWQVSFTDRTPGNSPGRTHSREGVGGRHRDSDSILGSSLYDRGNRSREDNARSGRLGIFTRNIWGRRSRLDPALTAGDRPYVDGSYRLGQGTRAQDQRFQQVREVIADWGHAVGSVVAHEVGHSVGLLHDSSQSLNLMSAATGASVLSDRRARFGATSAARLDRNLGKSP